MERRREQQQCIWQMQQFYQAFQAYRRDHGGEYPITPAHLMPRYLRSQTFFICPAYRPQRFSIPVLKRVRVSGQVLRDTYYFPYLALRDPAKKLRPDKVPLMVCYLHAEELYEDHFRKWVTRQERGQFLRRFGIPYVLALRRDGRVAFINDLDQAPFGFRGLEL